MGLLFRSLCFAIFMHEVISDMNDDLVLDIISNRLDYFTVTLSKIARKQKDLETKLTNSNKYIEDIETKLELNTKLLSSNKQHHQHSDTGSDVTENGLIEELSVLKKAISAEKEYVRSLENKIDAMIANQISVGDNRRRSEMQRENPADQTESKDLRSRMQIVEKDLKSFESLANKMEDRIDQVETDIDSLESMTNFLENRTDSMGENLEYADKITGKIGKRVDSVEKDKNKIENKLELMENEVDAVETMTTLIKHRVDAVENKIDFVELASDGFDKRMDTIESTITIMTEAANKKVSFFAQFEPPTGTQAAIINKNRVIPFKHVIYNEGSGLNTTSGTFIVPISGVYKFVYFVEGFNYDGDNTCPDAVVGLFVDGTTTTSSAVAEAWHLKQTIQSGNQYINYLMKGQEVGVATANVCEKHTIFGYRTSFSGVLLH